MMEMKNDPLPVITPEKLNALLMDLKKPDTNTVMNATKILKTMLQHPQSLEPFCTQLVHSPDASVRQTAAIILRSDLSALYKKTDAHIQKSVRNILLTQMENEPDRTVLKSIGGLVLTILKVDNDWEDAYRVLQGLRKSPDEMKREVGYTVFRNIGGTLVGAEKWITFIQVFGEGIVDPCMKVKMESFKGVAGLATHLDPDDDELDQPEGRGVIVNQLVPKMLEILQVAMNSGDGDAVGAVIEVFNDISEKPVTVFGSYSAQILQIFIGIFNTTALDSTIRRQAATFLSWAIKYMLSTVVKANLIPSLMGAAFDRMVEPEPEEDDDTVEEHTTLQQASSNILDSLFIGVPAITFEPGMKHAAKLAKSPQCKSRQAGLLTFMIMAEGCFEQATDNDDILKQMTILVCEGLVDPEPSCRRHAAQALMQFANHFIPEILKLIDPIMESIVQLLKKGDEIDIVKERAWNAVDAFINAFDDVDDSKKVDEFLGPMMQTIGALNFQGETPKVQKTIVEVIGTLANVSMESFRPYYAESMKFLSVLMSAPITFDSEEQKDERLELMAEVIQSMGFILNAVGTEHADANTVIQIAVEVLDKMEKSNSPILRSAGGMFFGSLAELCKDKLRDAPCFPKIMAYVHLMLLGDDGISIEQEDDNLGPAWNNKTTAIEMTLEDLEEQLENNNMPETRYFLNQEAISERTAAIGCASEIMKNVKLSNKELRELFECLVVSIEYPHSTVRVATSMALHDALLASMKANNAETVNWEPGVVTKLPKPTEEMLDQLYPAFLDVMRHDEEEDNVACVIRSMSEFLLKVGIAGVHLKVADEELLAKSDSTADGIFLDMLIETISDILTMKVACQSAEMEEAIVEGTPHKQLTDSTMDLINALARAGGPQFEPHFRKIFPLLFKFHGPNRHKYDRSTFIGCIADVLHEFSTDVIQPYLPKSFEVAFKCCTDEEPMVRQNAVFCLGALCNGGGALAVPYHEKCMEILIPLLQIPKKQSRHDDYIRDNAVSALAKLLKHGQQRVQAANPQIHSQLLTAIVESLPLERDMEENHYVYPCLVSLIVGKIKGNINMTDDALLKATQLIVWASQEGKNKNSYNDRMFDDDTLKVINDFLEQEPMVKLRTQLKI